jgi:hypothetical protein
VADAIRFIFEYDGDEMRLVSQQHVDVAVTGFDLPSRAAAAPGVYVQVRGADGAALADVPVRGAPSRSVEVFPERPGAPIVRTDVDRPQGAFTVVVPAPAAARRVAVVRVEQAPGARGEREAPELSSTELAAFDLEPES